MQEYTPSAHPEPDSNVKISIHTKPDIPRAGEPFEIKVTLAVDEGWHINAANATEPHLVPTSVSVQSDHSNIAVMSIDYPAPVASLKGASRVYKGRVSIPVVARIHPGIPKAHVNIHIRYQACADNVCSEPTDLVLNFPIICEE